MTGLARTTDPITSKESARRAPSKCDEIILALAAMGEATADEVVDWLRRRCDYAGPEGTIETAMSRMVNDGRLQDVYGRLGKSRYGRPMKIRRLAHSTTLTVQTSLL